MQQRRRNRKRYLRRRRQKRLAALVLIAVVGLVVYACLHKSEPEPETPVTDTTPPATTQAPTEPEPVLQVFAREHGLTLDQWPIELIEQMQINPEIEEFVLNYPLKKDASPHIDLSEHLHSDKVPMLWQWDERWGYLEYSNNLMGMSGCGPTCLSMVCLYLLDDPTYTPKYIAEFAKENGYVSKGHGSAWTLISKGGEKLGLEITEIALVKKRIANNLEAGNPIICIMGPGLFTTSSHYIVLTEYADGFVKVNDPYSPSKSAQQWNLDEIMPQIRNLWVCSVPAAQNGETEGTVPSAQ